MFFFGEFQIEHLIGQTLFKDPARANALADLGYTRDMPGNFRALFTSDAIVNQLANAPADNPFTRLLVENGWGTALHRGGDISVGGFQEGKNAFQTQLVDRWIALRDNGSISTEQLRYSVDYLSQFSQKLATGEILGGVLGGKGTEGSFLKAFKDYTEASFPEAFNATDALKTGGFDPRTLSRGNLATEALRSSLDVYHNDVTTQTSSVFQDENGDFKLQLKMPEARYEAVQRLIIAANEAGITDRQLADQQIADQMRTLGEPGSLDAARIRNAGIMAYQDIASGSGLDIGNDPQFSIKAAAERLAIESCPSQRESTGTDSEGSGSDKAS